MSEVLTAQQMRILEQAAIRSGAVTGLELMERAGRGVVEAVFRHRPDLARGAHKAVVLCGPGNNGGDGFVIARLLRERGWEVQVRPVGWPQLFAGEVAPSSRTGDAWENASRWQAAGGVSRPYEDFGAALQSEGRVLVVDALLGTGQGRSTDDILHPWWQAWDGMAHGSPNADILRVSVDVPTGYDTDSGEPLGKRPFEADLTVAFHAMKPVHLRLIGEGQNVVVADIGL